MEAFESLDAARSYLEVVGNIEFYDSNKDNTETINKKKNEICKN